jgi:hypothetical protein
MRLVATINDNATTTLTDNVADAARGAYMPWKNTTGGLILHGNAIMAAANETYTVFGFQAYPGGLGYDNLAIGPYALLSTTTGTDNAAVGPDALRFNTTGSYNMGLGESALFKNTIGTGNAGFGANALRHNTTGNYNVAMGYEALRGATAGGSEYTGNIAVGGLALTNITVGASNVAIGHQAGFSTSSGIYNVSVGHNALYSVTTTAGSTGIGEGALALATGAGNIGIGYRAGYHETGSSKLFIDGIDRASEAGERTLSLIYGVMGAAPKDQTVTLNAFLALAPIVFADLGTPANGTLAYCSDCTIAGTCAGSGTGAFAKRLNGVWVCN